MVGNSQWLRMAARWIPSGALASFGRPVALAFHGVARSIQDPRIEVSHHSVDEFAKLARTLRTRFDVLPLGAIDDVLRRPERNPRAVFLTCDDGYLNASTATADILGSFNLPWSLFISTHHIDTAEPNPLLLARLFCNFAPAGCYSFPNLPVEFELKADREDTTLTVVALLRRIEATKAQALVAAMTSVFSEAGLQTLIERFAAERFLRWSDVATLAAYGVEVGAHAHWHWPMSAAQSPEYLQQQAKASRDAIVRHVGHCRYFAYPFGNMGDVSATAWRSVRDAGYSHAFTTISATLDGGANPWLLPRYVLKKQEPNLTALLPMLRAGNARLVRWQRQLAA
jgi:peptidoglycan/xylan/chitin deacetylase (PgdA/CDA1 family)